MGGVAGHMDHLYDNPNLTFSEMKEIMKAASDGKLDAEEKVDGQNLFLSYSIPEGKAKGARNKGHYRTGGMDAVALATKFAGRGDLENAFVDGFSAFEIAAESLSDQEKEQIFGPDANIWYNSEIMDPGSANVILYDDKTLKIHDVGHFLYDKESDEQKQIPDGSLQTLDNAFEKMQESLRKNKFSIARKAIINLEKLEDDEILKNATNRLNTAIKSEGLSDSSTMRDYMFARLLRGMDTDLPEEFRKELVKYLLKLPGNVGLRNLKRGLKDEDLQDIVSIVNSKQMLLKQAILPIEMIVHDFTVGILKALKSVFIADNDKEVARLKQELAKAVQEITSRGAEDPNSMEVMNLHLNKIKDFTNITTPIEAIVFDYNGHTYKFAGNFSPINQILGMFRYPKGSKTLSTENQTKDGQILTNKIGKRIALIPGGFKPPHAGHFMLANYFARKKDIDEVYIIVSTKSRPPVTVDAAIKLWDLYTKDMPKVKVMAGSTPSPVGDVYELIADNSVFKEGDTALLGKSEKDADDKRFDRAQSYAERNNPGVNVESVVTPLFAGGVSGTQMRNFLLQGDRTKGDFKKNLPRHLDAEERELAYNIASSGIANESFYNYIDSTIEEMSSMAGGSIEGSSGGSGFGPPNTYNSFKRSKSKRPKVKRAKRQRRR